MANKRFIPTSEDRARVSALKAYGATHDDICGFIINKNTRKPISRETLEKVFADELNVAKWKLVEEAANNLLLNARGRPAVYDDKGNLIRAEKPPDTTAAIFLCKAIGKWTDRVSHEHSGKIEGGTRTVYLIAGDEKL